MISIIVPYLSDSPCISICKKLLKDHTINQYELIEIVDSRDVYDAFNSGVRSAKGEIVILISDDMFVSKGWDIPYKKYARGKTVCTGYLVEPGAIQVSPKNIEKNFGKTPSTFDSASFFAWADEVKPIIPECVDGKGWYMPLAMEKKYWVDYPNEKKFPYPNDIDLIDNILPNMGYSFLKVNSIVYHLQAFTARKDVARI